MAQTLKKKSSCNAGDPGLMPSRDLEDPLEKEMATHSSILAWEIPWTEDPDRVQSMGLQESDTTQQLNHHHHLIHSLHENVEIRT